MRFNNCPILKHVGSQIVKKQKKIKLENYWNRKKGKKKEGNLSIHKKKFTVDGLYNRLLKKNKKKSHQLGKKD